MPRQTSVTAETLTTSQAIAIMTTTMTNRMCHLEEEKLLLTMIMVDAIAGAGVLSMLTIQVKLLV